MRIAIDTGGTFTDCVFVRDGKLQMVKVASRRGAPEEAIAEAVRQALRELEFVDQRPRRRRDAPEAGGDSGLDCLSS